MSDLFPREWAGPVAARYAALRGAHEASAEVRGELHAEAAAALSSGFEDMEPWARELPEWMAELATDAAAWQAHQARLARRSVGVGLRELTDKMRHEDYARLRRRTLGQIAFALIVMVCGGALLGFDLASGSAFVWWTLIVGVVMIAFPVAGLRKDIRWLERHAEDTLAVEQGPAASSSDLRSP